MIKLDIICECMIMYPRMVESITVMAPAKINIGLKVFQKRSDGYHNIQGIFTTVSLFDILTVEKVSGKNMCIVECDGMDLPADNTLTSAYKAFCVLTGINDSVHVKVKKNIPSGGGLGGGSSDASSFLQSIDKIFCTHLSSDDLLKISGEVGSDVFFFTKALLDGDGSHYAAIVEGRGEKIRRIACRKDYDVVLLFPGVSVSTKAAYSWVDEVLEERKEILYDFDDEYRKPIKSWQFCNDFTSPVSAHHAVIGEAIGSLRRTGADFADMTGSGSTVYGIFGRNADGTSAAGKACEELSKKWSLVLC